MVDDVIIDGTLANMAVEFVTYNPSFNTFILSTVKVTQNLSGSILPIVRCTAVKRNIYFTAKDKFRAVQEILYFVFIFFYLYKEIKDFVKEWRKVVREVSSLDSQCLGRG